MKKRLLGRTNIEVSEISFGGAPIGIPYGIGISREDQMLGEEESIKLLQLSLDKGVNFFDAGRVYGRCENLMGRAFKNRRKEAVICTKCRNFVKEDGSIPKLNELKPFVEKSLNESLADLQTDYIDVFMIHSATESVLANQDVAKVFTDLKKKGVTRSIGVSTYTAAETKKTIESGIWEVIQLPFSIIDQRQKEVFPLAKKHGVGIVIRSVLFKGILTERNKDLHPKLKSVTEHCAKYDELLNKDITKLSDLAVKFVLSFDEVSSVLVGIDKVEYLEDAIRVANGKYLDKKTFEKAKQMSYPEPEFLDLTKWNRMGWLV